MSSKNTTPKIAILCPTRNRPENVRRMVASARETASDVKNLEFVFYVDEDAKDSSIAEIPFTKWIVGDRVKLTESWNRCAEEAEADIWMQAGDDIVFQTEGWDKLVIDSFKDDPIWFVYGNDGYAPLSFGTHGFNHRKWAEVVGYWHPPYLDTFTDTWFNDVAKAIKRHKYIPIYTEHLHYVNGKSIKDMTYQEKEVRDNDFHEQYEKTKHLRQEAIDKLNEYISDR